METLETLQQITTESTPRQRRRPFSPVDEIVPPFYLPFVVGLSSTTCWRLRKSAQFPAPIRLSAGRIGWRRTDLEQWLAARAGR